MSYPLPPSRAPRTHVNILLVEDDDVDAMAVTRMFSKVVCAAEIHLHRAPDGELGLQKLRELNALGNGPTICLLDINMPRASGHDFLRMMRQDPEVRATTVFVLTTSADPDDVKLAYDRHVAGYLTKSSGVSHDGMVGRLISDYAGAVIFPKPRGDQQPSTVPA